MRKATQLLDEVRVQTAKRGAAFAARCYARRGGPRTGCCASAERGRAIWASGVRTCKTAGGSNRPAGIASGPVSAAAAKQRLQWSQAWDGACCWLSGDWSCAPAASLWQMTVNGSTAAACTGTAARIACSAMAKHATKLTLLRILPSIAGRKPRSSATKGKPLVLRGIPDGLWRRFKVKANFTSWPIW